MSGSVVPRAALGSDGYTVSRLIVGGWQLSDGHRTETVDEGALFADLARMARAGWTTFDCADIYTGVEERFGRFRKAFGDALAAEGSALQFHTKYVPDLDDLGAVGRADVERIIDRSLQRLGVERLDLVQFSWWDYAVPRYVEVALWLEELRHAGKIRHVGVTNFDAPRVDEMLAAGASIVSNQVQYSLLDRRPTLALAKLAERTGLGFLCYGALAGGFLSDRYLGAPPASEPFANRSLVKYRLIIDEAGGWERYQGLLAALHRVAERHRVPLAAVALRWLLDRDAVRGVMIGTFHGRHLDANLAALGITLSSEDVATLNEALRRLEELRGDAFGLERIPDGPHSRIMWKNLSKDRH